MIKDRGSIAESMKGSVVAPEGVSFDGSTDYLSRSSDLVGNVDSKTFTFSCWVYLAESTYDNYVFSSGETTSTGSKVFFNIHNNGLELRAYNTSGSYIMNVTSTSGIELNTWCHIVLSFDMANSANSKCYINDTLVSLSFSTFTNTNVIFTNSQKTINTITYATSLLNKSRLSNLFLAYEYVDLSVESNRRMFITADGKPADGLASLNPILYLPMKDASTAHINEGTGGDFVQNGTLATADRGANQDNCVASKFDGVDDYLSSTGIGASDSKQVTFSCTLKEDLASTGTDYVLWLGDSTALFFTIRKDSGYFRVNGRLTDYNDSINITIPYQYNLVGFSRVLTLSFDLTDINSLKCFINGSSVTPSVSTYVDQNIKMTYSNNAIGNSTASTSYKYLGSIGELYFDTNYIDLSTNNPFWDSETNKPIPVRKAMANLGSNPLICMPIDASNPTKNYGSGGDFTLNGGGLTGARGMSEYISRTVTSNTSSDYFLSTSSLNCNDTKTGCFACLIEADTYNNLILGANFQTDIAYGALRVYCKPSTTGGGLVLQVRNQSGSIKVVLEDNTTTLVDGDMYLILASFDVSDSNKTSVYINGSQSSLAQNYLVNELLPYSEINKSVACANYSSTAGSITTINAYKKNGFIYYSNGYIDFSQESNRNLFVNQLGYPRDLTPEIEAGNIPTPLIYLPFDDTSNLGKNLGTGGDFTINGTVTAGADFTL